MMTAAEGGGGSEGGVAASGTAGGTSSVSSHVPQWKNQLSMRSKQPASGTCTGSTVSDRLSIALFSALHHTHCTHLGDEPTKKWGCVCVCV